MATAPQPPMPLAIDALLPESSASGDSEHLSESGMSTARAVPIDYNKYRTRMCHYFLIDKPCPFGERCAFAHGEEQINTPMPQAALERLMNNHNNHHHHHNGGGYSNGGMHHSNGYFSPNEGGRPSYNGGPRGNYNSNGGSSYNSPLHPYPRGQGFAGNASRHSHALNGPIHHMHQSIHGSSNVTRVNSMNDSVGPTTSGGNNSTGPSSFVHVTKSASGSFSHMPPPPAYACNEVPRLSTIIKSLSLSAIHDATSPNSDPLTPTSECPNRFRYDPYSPRGFVLSASA